MGIMGRLCRGWRGILQAQVLFSKTSMPSSVVKPPMMVMLMHTIRQHLEDVLTVPEASRLIAEKKTHELCSFYGTLIPEDRTTFLKTLAHDYVVDHNQVQQLASNLNSAVERGPGVLLRAQERLRHALVPRYQHLFTQVAHLDNGVKFLVDMRTHILGVLQSNGTDRDDPYLHSMNNSLRDTLVLWFSVGFLQLERVTWESPCDMVQKISDYEAVHPIRNWLDLKRRMGSYRRCFVFTHHCMPREPVVVLHTALTNEISSSIQSIVQRSSSATGAEDLSTTSNVIKEDPQNITTAIFYSITSTQKGLAGVELGNYLIKSVVKELLADFPHMHQFSSLSPIPGFKDWLITEINKHINAQEVGEELDHEFFLESEVEDLKALGTSNGTLLDSTKKLLQNNHWVENEENAHALRGPLLRLCARYLYLEKRRNFALNPVANFHMKNGAMLWRINWMADTSPRGLSASCGIMVNYRYFLDDTEHNSKAYMEQQHMPVSGQVLELVRQNPSAKDIVKSEPTSNGS